MFKAILIAAAGLVFWLWRSGRLAMWASMAGRAGLLPAKTPREPYCGRCGYIVRGISSFTCPECGKDLREVGIVTGRQERANWSRALMLAVAWSVAMYGLGAFVAGAVIRALPQDSRVIYTARLEGPKSRAYHRVMMQGSDVCRMESATNAVPKRVLSLMNLAGRNGTLDLNIATGGYVYTGADGKKTQADAGFDVKAVLDWMKAVGVDTTLPGLEVEALEIVDRATAAPPPYQGTSHFSSHASGQTAGFAGVDANWDGAAVEPKGRYAAAAGTLFLVWIGGLWVIVRRYAPGR